jgi:hypothetical protein
MSEEREEQELESVALVLHPFLFPDDFLLRARLRLRRAVTAVAQH